MLRNPRNPARRQHRQSSAGKDRRRLQLELLEDRRVLAVMGPLQSGSGISSSWGQPGSTGTAGEMAPLSANALGWIVRMDGLAGAPTEQLAAAQARVQSAGLPARVSSHLGQQGVVLVQSGLAEADLSLALAALPGVRGVEPNFGGSTSAVLPNDPLFSNEWGLDNTGQPILGSVSVADADIDAPEAWEITRGNTKTVVGVIDSGIDYTHPELYRNIWINNAEIPASLRAALTDTDGDGTITFRDLNEPANAAYVTNLNSAVNSYIDGYDVLHNPSWANGNDTDGNGYADDLLGWNFVSNTNDPLDDLGHGTHVAGTIGARTDNNLGVAGVNWDTTLMAVKWINQYNFGTGAAAIAAVNYATMMKQRGVNMPVTNNSWFVSPYSQALYDAVKGSRDAGMLFVASAGNNFSNTDFAPNYPSSFDLDNIVSVAATTQQDGRAGFSNFGPRTVDLGAPGQNIYSTVPNNLYAGGYLFANGTSMAAPHVTGVAALAYSKMPGASYQQVRDALLLGVDPNFSLAGQVATGGRLNAFNTLQMLDVDPTADAAGDTLNNPQQTSLVGEGTFGVNATIGDGLFPLRDVDLYRFEATAANQVLTAVRSAPPLGTGVSTVLRLFQADGTPVALTPASFTARLEYQFAAPGTYYLGVSGAINTNYDPAVGGSGPVSNRGDYRLDMTIRVPTPDAAGQVLDAAAATGLSGDGTYSATAAIGDGLYPLRDVDLYRFYGTAGQVLTAATSTPTGGTPFTSVLRLFDESGVPLHLATVNNNTRLEFQLPGEGYYFLGVSGTTSYDPQNATGPATVQGGRGDYRLELTLATPVADAAGQTKDGAAATGLGPASTFNVTTQIGDGLFPSRDVDLYRLDVTAGQGLTAATSAVAGEPFVSTALRLFDSHGTQLVIDSTNSTARFQYVFRTGGDYYVGVSSRSDTAYDILNPPPLGGALGTNRGTYRLDLKLETAVLDSVGDTLDTALNITPQIVDGNYSNSAAIGDGFFAARDVDLYRLDAAQGQRLTFSVTPDGNPPSFYPIMRLFNRSGTPLWSTMSSSVSNVLALEDGPYYLGVSGYPNFGYNPQVAGSSLFTATTGGYRFAASVFTPTPDEGDSLATAVVTDLGPSVGTYSHTANVFDGAWGRRDVDLYRIEVAEGQVLRARAAQGPDAYWSDTVLRLFNDQGVEVAANDNYVFTSDAYIEYKFPTAGYYYVGVSAAPNTSYNPRLVNSGGVEQTFPTVTDYRLDLSLLVPTPDAAGDTRETALTTGLGSESGTFAATGEIGDGLYLSRDVDLYKFQATAGQVVLATASGQNFYPFVRLFDQAGHEVSNYFGKRLQYPIVTGGTYYLGVAGYPNYSYDIDQTATRQMGLMGRYELQLELVVPTPDAVGDTMATALNTSVGPSDGTYVMPSTRIGDGLHLAQDVDLYRFSSNGRQKLHVATSLPAAGRPTEIVLNLWSADGFLLAQSEGSDSQALLDYFVWEKGTYYVGVSSAPNNYYDPNAAGSGYELGGSGDYGLQLTLDRLSPADPTGPVGGGGRPLAQLSGQGQWQHNTGLPSGGNQIERTSINAWIDAAGVAHGVMSWDDVLNGLPGGGGQGTTGYNWVMRVDTLVIDANSAYVEGEIIVSNHDPTAVGGRTSWFVVDNGAGRLDTINGIPLHSGNFTIRSAPGASSPGVPEFFAGGALGSVDDDQSRLVLACALADIELAGLNVNLLNTLATDQPVATPTSPRQRGLEYAIKHWAPHHSLRVTPAGSRALSDPLQIADLTGLDALLDRLLSDPEISQSAILSQAVSRRR